MKGSKIQIVVFAWIIAAALIMGLNWAMSEMGEDAAWIWSCHSMGNGRCAPGQPWIIWQPGGSD